MSGIPEARLRGHHGPNVNQSPDRASARVNLMETISRRSRDMSTKSRDITVQECERSSRLAPQGGLRSSSSDTLNPGGAKEEPGNCSIASSASTNSRSRKSPSVVRIRTWPLFWTANRGVILVILAMFFSAVMSLTTRLLELKRKDHKKMEPVLILFLRMALTSVFGSIYLRYLNLPHYALGAKEIRLALLLRGIGGFAGVYGLYYSLQYLPLAGATVINSLAPLLGTWLSYRIMHVSYDFREVVAGLVSFIGAILIARPSSLFPSSKDSAQLVKSNCTDMLDIFRLLTNDTCPLSGAHGARRIFAVIFAVGGVGGSAVAFCSALWIGKRAHPLIISNYFAVISTVISAIIVFLFSEAGFRLPADGLEYIYLMIISASGHMSQFLFGKGLQYEKSTRPANLIYTQLLFALVFDKMIWDVSPGALGTAGGVLVLVSTLFVATLPKNTPSAGDEPHGDDVADHIELLESGNVQ